MIVYIAGKMTGLPDKGRGLFRAAAERLREDGHTVIDPSVLPDGLPTAAYMPICLAMLQQADAICMLPGWEDSPGALVEGSYAKYQKKIVFELKSAACGGKDTSSVTADAVTPSPQGEGVAAAGRETKDGLA
ncbi:MAG: DUF4406 domain-containing protein [Oscillospiraceae bacterium]|nr:DUF4406 domain-containing protein [Oscillospiraceae bacterium]